MAQGGSTVDRAAFQAGVATMPGAANRALRDVAQLTAADIRREAQRDVPTTGGHHVQIVVVDDKAHEQFVVEDRVRNPKAANLTLWLEFGTIHMAGRPFLYPAINRARAIYAQRAERALQSAFDATVNK